MVLIVSVFVSRQNFYQKWQISLPAARWSTLIAAWARPLLVPSCAAIQSGSVIFVSFSKGLTLTCGLRLFGAFSW
jgi:hypothetical protein